MKELASGMHQLAGTKTRYRRADAAPLTGVISGSAEQKPIYRQIFETIGRLLDREIVRLYKPGLNIGEVSDPHSAALGRRVSLGGYGFAGEFARGRG